MFITRSIDSVLKNTRALHNRLKIDIVNDWYAASKSEWKVSLGRNIFFQAMINNIIYSLMLNDILPQIVSEINIYRVVIGTSIILLYLSYYNRVLFPKKKDLNKGFFDSVLFSASTYFIGTVLFYGSPLS